MPEQIARDPMYCTSLDVNKTGRDTIEVQAQQ